MPGTFYPKNRKLLRSKTRGVIKKPKPFRIKYGEYKGHIVKAYINKDDSIRLPAIDGSDSYTSLDELIWSNPRNARELATWLSDWAEWAQDYIESDVKRKNWLETLGN